MSRWQDGDNTIEEGPPEAILYLEVRRQCCYFQLLCDLYVNRGVGLLILSLVGNLFFQYKRMLFIKSFYLLVQWVVGQFVSNFS